jgi:hypothetical protein
MSGASRAKRDVFTFLGLPLLFISGWMSTTAFSEAIAT